MISGLKIRKLNPEYCSDSKGRLYFDRTIQFINRIFYEVEADSGSIFIFISTEEHFNNFGYGLFINANSVVAELELGSCFGNANVDLQEGLFFLRIEVFDGV